MIDAAVSLAVSGAAVAGGVLVGNVLQPLIQAFTKDPLLSGLAVVAFAFVAVSMLGLTGPLKVAAFGVAAAAMLPYVAQLMGPILSPLGAKA